MVPADNPASDLLGGYKSLHSAFRKCRHCLATNEDIQIKVTLYNTKLDVSASDHSSIISISSLQKNLYQEQRQLMRGIVPD